ncbi:hypothetical protein O7606_01495 [Micromonospora sp. WMMD882]|uniref:hypothetical protein n=1 Tax=Micromonospora sp. WMMD882 TaxID=3015151 RepID=UPI00248B743D|nr:hypothetical protein [Micromonospora sp. WMMD882]WBB80097.1 hypothetical protein O7606_01495 [Micromonospora sp. WMMD882]
MNTTPDAATGPTPVPDGGPRRGRRDAPATTGGRHRTAAARRARQRRQARGGLGAVAAVTAAALVAGLLSWSPDPPSPSRPLTDGEADRLAAVRVTNYRDGRARLRATVGVGADRTEVVGWVDWSRPLVYLDVGGPGAGPARGLVQALPDLVAVRPDPTAVLTPALPPLTPPDDGWRIRRPPDRPPLAALLDLLFALSADRPDPAAPLRSGARRTGGDTVGGAPVDVLQVPGVSHPLPGDGTRYWVDRDARLRRMATWLPGRIPVTVELDRADRPPLRPVDPLGGRPGLPRELTGAEADRLARMPARNREVGGVALDLAVPTGAGANLRGAGWLDWTAGVAYLAAGDLDAPDVRTLARYDRTGGVTRAQVPTGDADPAGRPPLPPPGDAPWSRSGPGVGELDRLVQAALRAGRSPAPPGRATWQRQDSADGRQVDVIELVAADTVLRYWIDRTGLLRRLESRAPSGAWARLALTQSPVPWLPPAPAARPAR